MLASLFVLRVPAVCGCGGGGGGVSTGACWGMLYCLQCAGAGGGGKLPHVHFAFVHVSVAGDGEPPSPCRQRDLILLGDALGCVRTVGPINRGDLAPQHTLCCSAPRGATRGLEEFQQPLLFVFVDSLGNKRRKRKLNERQRSATVARATVPVARAAVSVKVTP